MRKLFFLATILFAAAVPIFGQDVDKLPSITVTGTAEVQVAPDEATFSLAVVKTDKELPVAKQQNDDAVKKILDLARRFSVAAENVKTDFISVEMKYDIVREPSGTRTYVDAGLDPGKRVFRGFEVSKTVIVKLTDLSRFEEFFGEVLKTGVTELSGVTFTTSKLRQHKDRARDMAMQAARQKATAMTRSVGQSIGKAIRIVEGNAIASSRYFNYSSNSSLAANGRANGSTFEGNSSEANGAFAPGAITVNAEVTVSFLLN